MELIRWASIALANSFPNSLLAVLTLMNLVLKLLYKPLINSNVSYPFLLVGVPMTILSGKSKFWIATPSAKNSGIDTIV